MTRPTLALIAKAPVAGRSKTRLCPPCSPEQAAALAEAALRDTTAAMAAVDGADLLVALDGEPGDWLSPKFEVVAQRPGNLGDRLAGVFEDCSGPALVIGMDAPQVTPRLLNDALTLLGRSDLAGVLGPAADGGFWAIGFRRAVPGAFDGVPMSVDETWAAQRRRLSELGLAIAELPELRDVDTWEDALAVAREPSVEHFAKAMDTVARELDQAGAASAQPRGSTFVADL